jgi:hypothetical protein
MRRSFIHSFSIHRCPPSHTYTNTHLLLQLSQRNLVAPNIEVVFPNPCATLPLDRTGTGWTSFGPTDDDPTGIVNIPFTFSLVGETYTNLRVNNNGYMAFYGGVDSDVDGWFTDIDTRGDDSGLVWYKATRINTFAVVWDRVGAFLEDDSGPNDSAPNTFQIMISDGNNSDMGIGNNICFCYKDMGSRARYGANVGMSNTNGASFLLGVFDHPGTDYDGPGDTSAGWDYLDNKSFCYPM